MRHSLLVVLLVVPSVACAAVIRVAPGDSLAAARDEARKARPNATIVLSGGTYALSEPLMLRSEDSDVTWEAQPDQTPVISGGKRVEGWREADLNGRTCFAAELLEVREGKWFFRQLWVNGRRATRARQPNQRYYAVVDSPDAVGASWDQGQSRFRFADANVPAGPFAHGAEAIVMTRWVESRLPIKAVDEASKLVSFARRSQWIIEPGDPYWLEGDGRWLDAPGEWFLDREGGTLYYLPRQGETIRTLEVIAPVLTHLIELRGEPDRQKFVQDVTFRGITFAHAEWMLPEPDPAATQPASGGFSQAAVPVPAAVQATAVRRVAFDDCTFRNLGTWALELGRASQRCRVTYCTFDDLGAGGIKLGDPAIRPGDDEQSIGNVIEDCELADGGNVFPSGVGIWIGQSFDNRVAHNRVADFFYSGISVGWTWGYGDSLNRGNVIEKNLIHHVGQKSNGEGPILSDMGGVYLLGAREGTVVRNNVFHDVDAVKYGGWGIYLDEGSSNVAVENNLVYRTKHGAFHLHYGRDNVVRNNVLAHGRTQQIVRSRVEEHLSFTCERNVFYWTNGTALIESSPANVKFNHNLYGGVSPESFRAGGMSWEQWRGAGQDADSIIADPAFTDVEKDDFTLKPDSPAQQIGFVAFEVSDVGPRNRQNP